MVIKENLNGNLNKLATKKVETKDFCFLAIFECGVTTKSIVGEIAEEVLTSIFKVWSEKWPVFVKGMTDAEFRYQSLSDAMVIFSQYAKKLGEDSNISITAVMCIPRVKKMLWLNTGMASIYTQKGMLAPKCISRLKTVQNITSRDNDFIEKVQGKVSKMMSGAYIVNSIASDKFAEYIQQSDGKVSHQQIACFVENTHNVVYVGELVSVPKIFGKK